MTIVVSGGGSGGHIIPLIAVSRELKKLRPEARIIYIGQKGDSLAKLAHDEKAINEEYGIRAGKFRRYHKQGLKQVLDVPTLAKNTRDVFYAVRGIQQARKLLKRLKPDVIFVKGGYVGMPVGVAAGRLGIPYITHDSDTTAGLANRMIAKKASRHAVGMPPEFYNYPKHKMIYTGVPVAEEFINPPSQTKLDAYRKELNITEGAEVVLVMGGGLGAREINTATVNMAKSLLSDRPRLHLLHITGQKEYHKVAEGYKLLPSELHSRLTFKDFTSELYKYSAVADVVVTRAGATAMAELAAQHKACIVIPNPFLTGGHQLKNAEELSAKRAVEILPEETLSSSLLQQAITNLLKDPERRVELQNNIGKLAVPDAVNKLAEAIVELAEQAKQT